VSGNTKESNYDCHIPYVLESVRHRTIPIAVSHACCSPKIDTPHSNNFAECKLTEIDWQLEGYTDVPMLGSD